MLVSTHIRQVLLVLFISILQPAKYESEEPVRFNDTLLEYHKPTSLVPYKCFIILLAALKCDSFGVD